MAETGRAIAPVKSMCYIYARESKQRFARVLFWQTRHFIQAAEAALFDSITPFRSAALVIFHVLAECADDALFATDSGSEFLVQASESLVVVSVEGVEHGFGEV